jgi:hypothetical protein
MIGPSYLLNLNRVFALRRPFSRKVALHPDGVLTDDGRAELLALTQPLARELPLAAMLQAVVYAYAGDTREFERSLATIGRHGLGPRIGTLYKTSDLRSRLIECFRDHCAHFGLPPRHVLRSLLDLAQRTDAEFARIEKSIDRPNHLPKLVAFDYVSTVPAKLRVHLYVRARFFGSRSRMHDIGVRIHSALAHQNVEVHSFDLDSEVPGGGPSDLVLVDDALLFRKDAARKRAFLERLRSSTGRLGFLEFDPWTASLTTRIGQNRDLYDFIWAPAPTRIDNGKIGGLPACAMPFPTGCHDIFERFSLGSAQSPRHDIQFCGAIEEYNFHRYFWVLAISLLRDAVPCEVTNHVDDGLDAETSLTGYVERLSNSYAALGFTMRSDGTSILVGRTFDTLRLGQLLIQEYCPDVRHYLTPDEHFIEFQTLSELDAIRSTLRRDGRFEDIRANGRHIFAERYSDEAILRHLCTFV